MLGLDIFFVEILGMEKVWLCDLVFLLMGFVGFEKLVSNVLCVGYDEWGNYDVLYG